VALEIVRLTASHNVLPFECGEEEIERHLKSDALWQNEELFGATYVAVDPADPAKVYGFYSLQVAELINKSNPPGEKKLKGLSMPIVKVTHFGVQKASQRQKIGETMLFDLYRRAYDVAEHVGCYAVCLEAINNDVVGFYNKYGMVGYAIDPRRLWLRISDVPKLGLL
jgi:GNAT superfamily N-acetyltransferase